MAAATQTGATGRYYDQLNTLRMIAVAIVLAEHWMFPLVRSIGLQGSYGVWIFFTISGFLITGILLDYKAAVKRREVSFGKAIGVFYARRFLRIFPAYYLLLAVAMIMGPASAAAGIWWHVSYLSNFYFLRLDEMVSLGHLWSLAVEEQFYFVWPLLVLLLPRRALVPAIVLGIVGAIAFRIIAEARGWGLASYVMPVANLDTLGLGALLAWLRPRRELAGVLRYLVMIGVGAIVIWPLIGFAPDPAQKIVSPLIVGLASVALIHWCANGVGGPVGRVLSFRPFLYLGQISYGLYLFQSIAAWTVPEYIGVGSPGGGVALVASASIRLALVIAIASLSWFVIEQPLNRQKRHFTLRPREQREPDHVPDNVADLPELAATGGSPAR